ncbi:MAG: choice-of-anchor J domain-containing protein, partial [Muribaculaceae bacterium]|nr:choice-of-anchor J domain-containing protein [Muribaculaceae bacterium]
MKRINFYLSMLLLMAVAVGCSDEFDTPPMVIPTAEHQPNMTIADFKAKYWQDPNNYIDTIKEDVVIHGYVTSSDVSGNIYKSLYIQDETGGLALSVNGNSLYNTYRIGQEIVIPMKDLFIGKYNGQQQIGYPQWYAARSVWEATFLPLELFQSVVEINGLPDLSAVDTIPCSIDQLKENPESFRKWQGQLVKFTDVKFEDADGTTTFAEASATTNRNIVDANGNVLVMRNSNYADFRASILPMGTGDVVGLLSYYNTSASSTTGGTWQLYIRTPNDCIGFTTTTKGLLKDPYTVTEAIEAQNQEKNGWVFGYIVGAVAPEVTTVSSNSDIQWGAPTTLDNTIVIADDPNETDYTKCIVVPLPQNTPFRAEANLRDNEAAYKTGIYVKGDLATYMSTSGITGNSGSREEYKMTIVTGGITELNEGFDSSLPDSWTNLIVSGDKKWYQTSFDNNGYAAMTGYKGTKPPFDAWLITPALDIKNAKSKILTFRTQVNGYGSTTSHFEVYVLNSLDPTTASKRVQLNPAIAVAPSSGYSSWVESGDLDLSEFADGSYYIGFRFEAKQDANYATWCVDDVKFGLGPAAAPTRDDFITMNNGTPTATFGTYTSKNGWVATNCSLSMGGASDANPVYKYIIDNDTTGSYGM